MKSFDRTIRFVAVSATVPNVDDVGRWLRGPSDDFYEASGSKLKASEASVSSMASAKMFQVRLFRLSFVLRNGRALNSRDFASVRRRVQTLQTASNHRPLPEESWGKRVPSFEGSSTAPSSTPLYPQTWTEVPPFASPHQALEYKVFSLLAQHGEGKPALVFAPTRNGTFLPCPSSRL